MADKEYIYLAAGVVLVAAAGVGGWYIMGLLPIGPGPRSQIVRTRGNFGLVQVGNGYKVEVEVANTGTRDGYFKIQALVVSTDSPTKGVTGYASPGEKIWSSILDYVQRNYPYKGGWFGAAEGQGWSLIQRGQTATLSTPVGGPLMPGNYDIYINAAVSTSPTGKPRLFAKEHYLWIPANVRIG